MKCYGKIAGGLGLALLTGLCGCQMHVSSPASGDSGKVDIHVDAKDENENFSLNIKGAFGNTVSEAVKETYTAANVLTVKVVETSGSVQIIPQVGDTNEITVIATKYVNGDESESLLKHYRKRIKPMVKFENAILNIYTERDDKQFEKHGGWIAYEIHVPKRVAAQVQVSSGDVKIKGLASKVAVETSSGDIELEHFSGDLAAKASSGDITLKNSDILDKLELETTSGKIEAEDIRAQNDGFYVTLHSSSGDIVYRGSLGVLKSETTNGKQSLTLNPATNFNGIDVRASSGDIELTVPKSLKANLALKTSSGDISLSGTDNDSPDANEHKTTINGGGAPISLETTSGDITIEVQ